MIFNILYGAYIFFILLMILNWKKKEFKLDRFLLHKMEEVPYDLQYWPRFIGFELKACAETAQISSSH